MSQFIWLVMVNGPLLSAINVTLHLWAYLPRGIPTTQVIIPKPDPAVVSSAVFWLFQYLQVGYGIYFQFNVPVWIVVSCLAFWATVITCWIKTSNLNTGLLNQDHSVPPMLVWRNAQKRGYLSPRNQIHRSCSLSCKGWWRTRLTTVFYALCWRGWHSLSCFCR